MYRKLDPKEIFQKGDIYIETYEVCMGCDGDRSTFYKRSNASFYIRPINVPKNKQLDLFHAGVS